MAASYDMHEAVQDIWLGVAHHRLLQDDLPGNFQAFENAFITHDAKLVRNRNAESRLW